MRGLAVAERGKKPEKVKYDSAVKLRAEFKEALEGVAEDLGLYPGEFIEQRLGQFVRTEWKRILTEKLKRAQDQ